MNRRRYNPIYFNLTITWIVTLGICALIVAMWGS